MLVRLNILEIVKLGVHVSGQCLGLDYEAVGYENHQDGAKDYLTLRYLDFEKWFGVSAAGST